MMGLALYVLGYLVLGLAFAFAADRAALAEGQPPFYRRERKRWLFVLWLGWPVAIFTWLLETPATNEADEED